MSTVCVVDDNPELLDLVGAFLVNDGFDAWLFPTGEDFLAGLMAIDPDLVVLDLMLPGLDGFEVLRQVRARSSVPVIILTARGDDGDYCRGLALGADDYVAKPFKPHLLMARIKALLRRVDYDRPESDTGQPVSLGNVGFDPARNQFVVEGKPLGLTAQERRLLSFFLEHPGEALSRDRLLEAVWGFEEGRITQTRAVDEANRRLRKKLLAAGATAYNRTVRGVGYEFSDGR